LARGAFLLDKPLSKLGLHGRSFVPLLSSHACAIPGIMAARSIDHAHDRLVTMLVAPFMACAARLPVYALLIGALFGAHPGWVQGSILFALYALGIVAAGTAAWVVRRKVLRTDSSGFVMELGSYRRPRLSEVVRAVVNGAGSFVRKAGTVILVFSILLWAALTYPRLDGAAEAAILAEHGVSSEQVAAADVTADPQVVAAQRAVEAAQAEHAVAGRLGKVIEPILLPMGGDWRLGIGLIGSFAAREVFVGTMGVVYGQGAVEDETDGLAAAMLADTRADGSAVWSPLFGIVILVWFALAMQCISTVAVMRRETQGWRWPLIQLLGINVASYLLCVAIWQIGRVLV
ncbi:MAG: nucleoside recognition domain-containing protein, partial [Planctomycetota bacterium]